MQKKVLRRYFGSEGPSDQHNPEKVLWTRNNQDDSPLDKDNPEKGPFDQDIPREGLFGQDISEGPSDKDNPEEGPFDQNNPGECPFNQKNPGKRYLIRIILEREHFGHKKIQERFL